MFAPLEDGGCEVRFPGGKSVRLAPLTDAELAMSSTAGDDGLWLPMLEKAFATVRNESRPAEKRKDVPTDLIARGGAAGPCIELLTGKRAKSLAVRRKSERDREPDDERIREVLPQLREAIKAAVKDRRLICCGTPKEVATPGIAGKHMYAVLGYDEEKDLVDVWNPWGNSFKPKGDSGLKNGYRTKGGRFSVPLDDFVRVFGGITFECE
ncbi:MAG: hypothetical protein HYY17_11580 [Planctomycetes bacterium]|nr:hypothetical protein [Planctomycetota bacterium]